MTDAAVIGAVTGLRAEARCLPRELAEVFASGGSACRAREGARRLAAHGVQGLLSFGLAGGLAPALRAGDLLLPEVVVVPDGARFAVDPAWRRRVVARVAARGLEAHGEALAGSDELVTTAGAKQALRTATGALAVDMESHAVAAVAAEAGLPFLVVRAIADPADRALPLSAAQALALDGRIRPVALLNPLLRRPAEIVALIRLGRDSALGLRTLRRVALVIRPPLDLG